MEYSNQQHWDRVGSTYSDNWSHPARSGVSRLELAFIDRHIPSRRGLTVLDVGIGNGRISEHLLCCENVSQLVGLDISPKMIEICRKKFGGHPKVAALHVCDLSIEDPPVEAAYDVVTAIRMLKYSRNWSEILIKLAARLRPGGVIILSMCNDRSISHLSRGYSITYFGTTRSELVQLVTSLECDLLEVSGSNKSPDIVYRAASRPVLARSLLVAERALDAVLGRATLARELFVAARRQ
ncbi:class I SAM-dependent methyltransferase [Pseudonocardia hierapolitana]|nr:class I SAM-dependent methyltransferase [Pseudonocardia hierapolitana]